MSIDALAVVIDALAAVAPDADPTRLDDDLNEDLALDSMDLLNLAAAITERCAVEIPERDYGRLRTLRQLAEFVAVRAG